MKTNEFNSVFASLIVDFIEYKRAAGYKYVTEVAYLKKFDELCCTMDVQTPLLTKELPGVRKSHMKQIEVIFSKG